jgi:membrane protein
MWQFGGLSLRQLAARTWRHTQALGILDQSAKLSFYFLLALFPLLMVLLAVLGLVLQSGPALQDNLRMYLLALVPPSASGLIDQTLAEVTGPSGGVRVSVALLFTWLPAARGMLAIMDGLNGAYGVRERRPLLLRWGVASLLTMATVLLTSTALAILIYGGRLTKTLALHLGTRGGVAAVWDLLQWVILLAVVLLAFNIVYVYGPQVRHRRWHWLMPGTVVGVALWLAVSFAFKLYLTWFGQFSLMYGSLGAVVVLMLWLYLSGVAILVGAQVNAVIESVTEPAAPNGAPAAGPPAPRRIA